MRIHEPVVINECRHPKSMVLEREPCCEADHARLGKDCPRCHGRGWAPTVIFHSIDREACWTCPELCAGKKLAKMPKAMVARLNDRAMQMVKNDLARIREAQILDAIMMMLAMDEALLGMRGDGA
jgi:hypothetical protein